MKADWLSRNKGERKWLLVEADVRGVGTRDEPLRTFAWEATRVTVCVCVCFYYYYFFLGFPACNKVREDNCHY